MQASYWHSKWETGDTAFHEPKPHPFLIEHMESLKRVRGSRVFLPLCGKTRDIAWLLSSGYRVVGAELHEATVADLFDELGAKPKVSRVGPLALYQAPDVDLFVGNLFDLTSDRLGSVDAVYDRGALVALPAPMRERYTLQLANITRARPQLLVTYEYDQTLMDGPPFSVPEVEIRAHYGAVYQLERLDCKDVLGGLKGKMPARETAWLLRA